MNEGVDYQKVLDELLEERAGLDKMIIWVKGRLGREEPDNGAPKAQLLKVTEPMRFPRLAADAFFRMSVADGIKAFLAISKKPQTARAITDALVAGGLTFKAKNPYQTVFPTLSRMLKETQEVAKLKDNTWGLSEWYSPVRRTAVASPTEEGDK